MLLEINVYFLKHPKKKNNYLFQGFRCFRNFGGVQGICLINLSPGTSDKDSPDRDRSGKLAKFGKPIHVAQTQAGQHIALECRIVLMAEMEQTCARAHNIMVQNLASTGLVCVMHALIIACAALCFQHGVPPLCNRTV